MQRLSRQVLARASFRDLERHLASGPYLQLSTVLPQSAKDSWYHTLQQQISVDLNFSAADVRVRKQVR